MLGVGVIFGLLSPVSKALLDSGLISPAGLMMTRTAGAAADDAPYGCCTAYGMGGYVCA